MPLFIESISKTQLEKLIVSEFALQIALDLVSVLNDSRIDDLLIYLLILIHFFKSSLRKTEMAGAPVGPPGELQKWLNGAARKECLPEATPLAPQRAGPEHQGSLC